MTVSKREPDVVNKGGKEDPRDVAYRETDEERSRTAIQTNAPDAHNQALGGPGQEDGEGVDPGTRGILKGQTEGMEGPPGQAVAQQYHEQNLQGAEKTNAHLGGVEDGEIALQDFRRQSVVRSDQCSRRVKRSFVQVLPTVDVGQVNHEEEGGKQAREKRQQNEPDDERSPAGEAAEELEVMGQRRPGRDAEVTEENARVDHADADEVPPGKVRGADQGLQHRSPFYGHRKEMGKSAGGRELGNGQVGDVEH